MVQMRLMSTDKIILLIVIKLLSGITLATSGKTRGMKNLNIEPSNEPDVQIEDGEARYLRKWEKMKIKRVKAVERVDVVIIGAGWAGLSAARKLLQQSPPPTIAIIEANDYIGGRSRSVTIGDTDETVSVDLGSEWIESHTWKYYAPGSNTSYYGDCDEEVMNEIATSLRDQCPIAKELTFNLDKSFRWDHSEEWWDQFAEGKGLLSKEEENDLAKLWDGKTGFLAFEAKERARAKKNGVDESVKSALVKYETKKDVNDVEKNYLDMQSNANIGTNYAADLENLSLVESESKSLYLTKYFGKSGGFSTYPESTHMGGNFGNFANEFAQCESLSGDVAQYVRLKSQVKRIEYNRDNKKLAKIGYIKQYPGGKRKWKRIRAKAVLSTVSLGVLKADSIKFVPPLGLRKQEVINEMGYGTLDKWVGLWRKDQAVPWDNRINTTVVMSLVTDKNDTEHDNFDLFYNHAPFIENHKVLTGYISGAGAMKMEQNDDQNIHANAMRTLNKMFPASQVPNPFDFKVTRWSQHPSFKGSYSYPRAGRNTEEDAKILREPIGDLFFAGEATSKGWGGTVNGAYKSGHDVVSSSIWPFVETI